MGNGIGMGKYLMEEGMGVGKGEGMLWVSDKGNILWYSMVYLSIVWCR